MSALLSSPLTTGAVPLVDFVSIGGNPSASSLQESYLGETGTISRSDQEQGSPELAHTQPPALHVLTSLVVNGDCSQV